jgi:deoxyribose-phosphate aldolase
MSQGDSPRIVGAYVDECWRGEAVLARGPSVTEPHIYGYEDIAGLIDHALLAPSLTTPAIDAGLELARRYAVASVCVLPYAAERAARSLAGSGVRVTTTIGFPHGGHATRVKLYESECAIADGAVELDMVVNVSRVKSAAWHEVAEEIQRVTTLCHERSVKLKLIFENAFLSDAEKVRLCQISAELGVDWVKTSTGFGPSGATLADVELMRRSVPPTVAVKASGGIRDLSGLLQLRPFVTRVGTSSTQVILDECRAELEKR